MSIDVCSLASLSASVSLQSPSFPLGGAEGDTGTAAAHWEQESCQNCSGEDEALLSSLSVSPCSCGPAPGSCAGSQLCSKSPAQEGLRCVRALWDWAQSFLAPFLADVTCS